MDNFIGLNIKYLCKENFLSQAQFGEILGVGQSTVGGYISGRTEPDIAKLQVIGKHFSILIDDFLNLDLSKKVVEQNSIIVDTINEPQNLSYGGSDKLIAELESKIVIQEELITTQKDLISSQKDIISNLKVQLSQAS